MLERAAGIDAAALDADGRITLAALRESLGSDIAQLDTGLLDWNLDPLEGIPVELPADPRLPAPRLAGRRRADARPLAGDGARAPTGISRRCARASPTDGSRASRRACGRSGSSKASSRRPTPTGRSSRRSTDFDDAEAGRARRAERDRFASELTADRRGRDPAGVRPAPRRPGRRRSCPHARSTTSPGMVHVARRRDAYRRLIRVHTSLDLDAEALHQVGLDEIARIDARDRRARRAGRSARRPSRTRCRAARRPGALLRDARRGLRQGRGLPRPRQRGDPGLVRAAAEAPCEVVRMGAHEEEHSTIAYYRQPRDRRLAARPVLHQHVAPGRRARATRPRRSPITRPCPATTCRSRSARSCRSLPEFRRHLGPTAYFEGWGLYTERLADEMGLYCGRPRPDRRALVRRLARVAARRRHRACTRSAGRASRRSSSCSTTRRSRPNNIANEVDRYIALPGQALAYKIGQLELLRLRDEARRPARRGVRHPRLPRRGPGQRRPRPADAPRRRRGLDRLGARPGLMPDAPDAPGMPGAPRSRGTGAHRARRPARASPRGRSRASCATATSARSSLLDARRRRGLGAPRRRPARRLRRGRRRRSSASCR